MLRTLAIVFNQIVLSFGVFDSILITKAIQDWGEFYGIHGKAIGSSFTCRTQALKLYSSLPKANHECKEGKQREKSNMKNSRGQQLLDTFGALPGAQFMHTIFLSKIEKSEIQRFKRCAIRSWNEEVGAIGSRLHQAKGQFRRLPNHKRMAAKSAFGCEMVSFSLRNFAAILHAYEILLSASRYLRPTLLDFFSLDICCLNPHSLLVIHQS